MKISWVLLILMAATACHRRPDKSRAIHVVAAPAAAARHVDGAEADSVDVEPAAHAIYRQAFEQAQREITAENVWRQLRALERSIDDEREAATQ